MKTKEIIITLKDIGKWLISKGLQPWNLPVKAIINIHYGDDVDVKEYNIQHLVGDDNISIFNIYPTYADGEALTYSEVLLKLINTNPCSFWYVYDCNVSKYAQIINITCTANEIKIIANIGGSRFIV